jgi:hypothetical protein
VTALARPEDRRVLPAGFQTHVARPVDVVELVAASPASPDAPVGDGGRHGK